MIHNLNRIAKALPQVFVNQTKKISRISCPTEEKIQNAAKAWEEGITKALREYEADPSDVANVLTPKEDFYSKVIEEKLKKTNEKAKEIDRASNEFPKKKD